MGNPKHQHFIPRSYLKYFADKQEGQYFVDTLMKGKNEEIITLSIQNICVQKNLYTFPLNTSGDRFALEKFYAKEVDSVYPSVYDMLTNPNITIIAESDKRKILNTILSLFFRTPQFLNYRTENVDQIFDGMTSNISDPEQEITIGLKKGKQIKFKLKDLENVRQEHKWKIKEEFLIGHFAQWQEFVKYKLECNLEIVTVTDELRIITSDNPVVVLDMNGRLNQDDVFHKSNIIEVPIDRNTYLIIYPEMVDKNNAFRIMRSKRDKYFSAGVNRTAEKSSDLRIIGYPGDIDGHFALQQELGEWNAENLDAFAQLLAKTALVSELTVVIKRNKTAICQDVANKVTEIRKTGQLKDDEMFNKLIIALAKNGYLTI